MLLSFMSMRSTALRNFSQACGQSIRKAKIRMRSVLRKHKYKFCAGIRSSSDICTTLLVRKLGASCSFRYHDIRTLGKIVVVVMFSYCTGNLIFWRCKINACKLKIAGLKQDTTLFKSYHLIFTV